MSAGRLAAVHVSNPNTVTNIYTPTANKQAVITLSICNLNMQSVKIRIALQSNQDTTIGAGEWIEYDFDLTPNNTYERTGIVMVNPQTISVYSSAPVSAVVWGYEE